MLPPQPGERWLYHTGSVVLGILLERAAKGSLAEVLQRGSKPLGMEDTGFCVATGQAEAKGWRLRLWGGDEQARLRRRARTDDGASRRSSIKEPGSGPMPYDYLSHDARERPARGACRRADRRTGEKDHLRGGNDFPNCSSKIQRAGGSALKKKKAAPISRNTTAVSVEGRRPTPIRRKKRTASCHAEHDGF